MKKTILILMTLLSLAIITSCNEDENVQEIQIALTLQPDGDIGKDAVISKIVPGNNYGDIEDIHLYAWTQGGSLNVNRVLIDFDLSSIPSGAEIDSAFLSLYYNSTSRYGSEHMGDNSFFIQRITSDWDELTVSQGAQPSTTTNNQVSVEPAISNTQDFTNINITSLITDILDNIDDSYGIMLKLEREEIYKILLFASSDNQEANLRPKLDITYTITQ